MSQRRGILATYCLSFPIIMFLLVWIFAIFLASPPAKWEITHIQYSYIANERIGFTRGTSVVLHSSDGQKFVIPTRQISQTEAEAVLLRGKTYTIVHSKRLGVRHIEALYTDSETIVALSESVEQWDKEQNELFLAVGITVALEIITVILLDRLACKKMYARIRKLKQDIVQREEKIRKRQEGCR